MMPAITETAGGCIIKIKVSPGRGKFEVVRVDDSQIRINLKSQPEGGKANSELLSGLEKLFKVSGVKLIQGKYSRLKVVFIPGIEASQAAQVLLKVASS